MWKQLSSKQIFKHPRISLIEDEVQLPDGSVSKYLTFGNANDSVTVIAVRQDKILISKEYSYPVSSVLYQFPGGKVDPGEDPLEAARRELQEETGYKAKNLKTLGWYYTNNRRTNAKMHVYLATNPVFSKKEGGDKEEDIESEWRTKTEIEDLIRGGSIVNFSVLAAWTLYKSKA